MILKLPLRNLNARRLLRTERQLACVTGADLQPSPHDLSAYQNPAGEIARMETRPATIRAKIFHALGWSGQIPKPSGPHMVRSIHFRIPGDNGVLTQLFFPVELVEAECGDPEVTTKKPSSSAVTKRAYRNGVLTGFSFFAMTPKFLFDLFLGASPHPLADVSEHTQLALHESGAHSMPLIIFSHGLGGNCEVYTKACSDLAANGHIVLALEHEDGSGSYAKTVSGDIVKYVRPPQGMPYVRENVINFRAPFLKKRELEIRAAVEFFTAKRDFYEFAKEKDLLHCLQAINPDKVVLAGHSFGAASTVHTIRAWPDRFIGAILMDLWPFPIPELEKGIKNVPVCSILSENFNFNDESMLTWHLLQNSNEVLCSFYLPGSCHSSFSDTPWWAPTWLARKFNLRGTLEPLVAQECFNSVYLSFLKEILEPNTAKGKQPLQQRVLEKNDLLRPFTKSSN